MATIPIIGDLDISLLKQFYFQFHKIIREKPDKLDVYISTDGGDVGVGTAIIDMLRMAKRQGIAITTIASGNCQSGGGFIFLAGDERLISRSCLLMLHNYWTTLEGVTGKEGQKILENYDKQFEALLDVVTEHLTVKPSTIFEKCKDGDWYIMPDEAIKLKLATGYWLEDSKQKRKGK